MPRGAKKLWTIVGSSFGIGSTVMGAIITGAAVTAGSLFWPLGLALIGVGLVCAAFTVPKMIRLFTKPTGDSASTTKLEMLEDLRKISQTKDFDAFAKDQKNNFNKIKEDSDFIKSFQLYKLQKSYQTEPTANRFQEINTLRVELGLESLTVGEFRG